MQTVGVDAARGGWLAVGLVGGRFETALLHRAFSGVLAAFPGARVIGVDIPLGLPEDEPRRADLEARRFVGPRWRSVFLTPPRPVLEEEDFRRAQALGWTGLTTQSHRLRKRIFEVEAHLPDQRVVEVHPEVAFRHMAGRPLAGKRTWNGQATRRALLRGHGVDIPDQLGPAGSAAPDDVLDAAVAAWTAARVAAGEAETLPARPAEDEPRIWY